MYIKKYSNLNWKILKLFLGAYLIYFFATINTLFTNILSPTGLYSNNILWEKINWLRWLNLNNYDFYWIIGIILSLLFILFESKVIKFSLYFWWISWCINFPYYQFPPHIAYIGFTLLLVLFIENKNKTIPEVIFNSFIYVWGLGFSVSGLMKLLYTHSWQSGQIFKEIANSPIGYEYLLNVPEFLIMPASYLALIIELLSLPLVLFKKTRLIGLWGIFVLQIGILMTMDIPDLTIGIVICWLFLILPKEVKHEQ